MRGILGRTQAVDRALAHHVSIGLIRSWVPEGTAWLVALTEGKDRRLRSVNEAEVFCDALASAAQAISRQHRLGCVGAVPGRQGERGVLMRRGIFRRYRPERQAVWILHYSHKHGDDISLFITQEGALAAATDIAREYWDEVTWSDEVPATPDGLSDAEIREKFNFYNPDSDLHVWTSPTCRGVRNEC